MKISFSYVFSRVHATLYVTMLVGQSVGRLVGRLVGRSVGRLVGSLFTFWAYGSCPDAPVTFSSTAPAHPHAARVAVYPALLNSHLPPQ